MDLSRSGKSQFNSFKFPWTFRSPSVSTDFWQFGLDTFCWTTAIHTELWQKQKRPKCENLSAKKHVFLFSPPLTNWLQDCELKTLLRSDGVSLPPSATVPPWLEAGTVRESPIRGGNCAEPRCCVVAEGLCMVTYLHICTAFFFFFF